MSHQPSRRDFLSGSALVGPIRERAAAVAPRNFVHFSRRAMACEFSVFFPADQAAHAAARRSINALAALDSIDALEAQLSVYRADSEVTRLNRTAAIEPVVVERQLYDLLQRAHQLWQQTCGAFDITAGPLSRIWGFREREPRMPTQAEIDAALALVGTDKLIFENERLALRFAVDGLEIDLGAIGKGYALDRCRTSLAAAGETSFLLQGGRSSVLAVNDQGSTPWQIDLRYPFEEQPRIASLYLNNQAMATSGDAVQQATLNNRKFGHIIDPRKGWPAEGLVTATAFAPTAADADALATAFYLMGAQQTTEYCQRHPEAGAILVLDSGRNGPCEVRAAGKIPGKIDWHAAEPRLESDFGFS